MNMFCGGAKVAILMAAQSMAGGPLGKRRLRWSAGGHDLAHHRSRTRSEKAVRSTGSF